MDTQKLKQVFEKKIRPKLGQIQKEEKYLKVLLQLGERVDANNGKGIREAELTNEVKPATYILSNLARKGFVEITLPVGDGTLITDPINNRRKLFEKQEMITDYFDRFCRHLKNNEDSRRILLEKLGFDSEKELLDWAENLEDAEDFTLYNTAVFALLERGIEIREDGFGPLLWRKMAKYYNLSDKTKDLVEE